MSRTILPEKDPAQSLVQLQRIYETRFRKRREAQLWVFRGHSCSGWKLETALERRRAHYDLSGDKAQKLEEALLREFQRKAQHYLTRLPRTLDTLEWLSLMRHYGSPTRLLDWSYSFLVALYFACENATDECSVWALDSTWCAKQSERIVPGLASYEATVKGIRRCVKLLVENSCPLVYPINPFHLNERLTIQQGLFTWPGDITRSFEWNLAQLGDTEPHLLQIRIAGSAIRECLKELHRMNMSRATLYPGLEGFASSLNTRLAAPETLLWRR